MRAWTVWLALGLATLRGAGSVHAYFLDKDGNFDVRGRVYNQVAIFTENAAEQENCRVTDPNTGKIVVTPACLQFSSGNVGQERTFWNPELDAKLTPYIGWMNGAPAGLSVLKPDDLKFRFAWWGYYDGVFDYTNPEWAAALRAQRVRLAETDDTSKSFVFQDHSKNVRSILGHDNRINELYLDYTKDRFFFRVGRQAISWGESDTIALLDISNPFDLRVGAPGFFQDVDEARMPLWTLRSTIKLVENWRFLSGLFSDIYLVPGTIESTVPVNPTWFGTPYAGAQPTEDPQVAMASVINPVGGHVSIVDRLPTSTWSQSRYGARLGAVVAREYTVSTWFFRTYPEQPTPLITSPSFLELTSKKTLIDDRGNRVPVCNGLGAGGAGIGHTPSGRQCTFARPAVTELFRRLESVFGLAGTWYSPMVGGIIRSEAEYFLDEDAFIPHMNLNPQAQVPGTGVVNHIPQADYLRWTLGYDRFFFFRPLNPTNSFTLVGSWNGQWNVTASRNPNLNFRNPLVKPGKTVVGPLGQQEPDSNWEDQHVIEHFFQIALQTDYLHGKLEPRIVTILDPSGIFGLTAGAVYRLTDSILLSPNFLAVAGSRRTGLATFRDRDQFQLRVTYQLN